MDVRCEKCQTEYELDESRLKPGGVTVKCTHCGHLFKIRDAGHASATPAVAQPEPPVPGHREADSMLAASSSIPSAERLWLIRLETGEQKTCRELATLQQWIASGVVGRDAEISRSGKTWKRLGNIVELHPYFAIGDEARTRGVEPAAPAAEPTPSAPEPAPPTGDRVSTLRGISSPTGPGGTYIPHDSESDAEPPQQLQGQPHPFAQTELSMGSPQRRTPSSPPVSGNRESATWTSGSFPETDSIAAMPQGPRSGRLAMQDREPAFANRARIEPGRLDYDDDDDDDFRPRPRGSRAGMWLALISLLAIAGAAVAVYAIKYSGVPESTAALPRDASVAVDAKPPTLDAGSGAAADAAVAVPDPLASARADLLTGVESRLKAAYDSLASTSDAPALALRARLGTALAQSQLDRADLATSKTEADKLRKDIRQVVNDSATAAQRALQSLADDPGSNLAMAEVLRVQGKPAGDVQRYLGSAKSPKPAAAKAGKDDELARSIALCEARLLIRETKLDEAQKLLAALGQTGDNRIALALALIAHAQSKPAEAKPLVAAILATSPEHDAALALKKRLDAAVEKTDPLPPESAGSVNRGGSGSASAASGSANRGSGAATGVGGSASRGGGTATASSDGADYNALIAQANKLAESNCPKALEVYTKALGQNAAGVEALTGMGTCFLQAKQYSSAFSKFRTALALSNRHEPALAGIAETYHQQGNKEQEAEAWRKYLELYPNSAKAKKRLEQLSPASEPTVPSNDSSPPSQPAPSAAPPPSPSAAPAPSAPAPSSSAPASPPPSTDGSNS